METCLFKHIHKGMYNLSTGCDFCGIQKGGGGEVGKKGCTKKKTLQPNFKTFDQVQGKLKLLKGNQNMTEGKTDGQG
jgi:hypothetical protein